MLFEFIPPQTYATEADVIKAVSDAGFSELRHFIMTDKESGELFPVFVMFEDMRNIVSPEFNVCPSPVMT